MEVYITYRCGGRMTAAEAERLSKMTDKEITDEARAAFGHDIGAPEVAEVLNVEIIR